MGLMNKDISIVTPSCDMTDEKIAEVGSKWIEVMECNLICNLGV